MNSSDSMPNFSVSRISTPSVFFRFAYPFLRSLTIGGIGFGYNKICWAIEKIIPYVKKIPVELCFEDGSRFSFNLSDPYWNATLKKNYVYEPEILNLLYKFKDINYVFFDLGANLGYWSVLCSSEVLGGQKSIAIEASRENFEKLQSNQALNSYRFDVLHLAVSEKDNVIVHISGSHHSNRHISEAKNEFSEPVSSIRLDTLVSEYVFDKSKPILIKMDIEGAEISALKSIGNLLEEMDLSIIYEEHGKDLYHTVTRFLLENGSFALIFLHENGSYTPVSDITQLTQLKTNIGKGYNMLAIRNDSIFTKPSFFKQK